MNQTREQRRQLERDNAKWPETLRPVPIGDWPAPPPGMTKLPESIWRSRHFLVQWFAQADGITRLSVSRTQTNGAGGWVDGISWDDLQQIKREVGLGDYMAVEIYPKDRDIVNVANMRHIWVLRDPLPFGWRKS